MDKPRVHEVARELGVESKTVLGKLREMGEPAKSASSTVERWVVRRLRAAIEADSAEANRDGSLVQYLLAGDRRDARPDSRSGREQASQVTELLHLWDELTATAPDPDRCVDTLAAHGIPRSDVERLRSARNRCAHPAERGWPSSYELTMALTTGRELRRRVRGGARS
jgi:hypothetical protein